MKLLTVVGARPQFVKAFPVSARLEGRHEEVFVHTGQHYDRELSGLFFEELPIPEPDYQLGVGSGTHVEQTTRMMTGLDELLDREQPDAVVVYGDTNSTLAGAMVTAKRAPALVHVEAGLRSDDRSMPEEINRIATDHLADLLCTPSEHASERLAREGREANVVRTGDVMYDALQSVRDAALDRSTVLDRLGVQEGFVLATVHRAGNTDDPERLRGIVEGLATSERPVVFPAHPRTVEAMEQAGLLATARAELELIDPVGYLDFVRLLVGSALVATDSGGVQKEAFYLDTPCVTMRARTEWVETVDSGWNVLVGADKDRIRGALASHTTPETKPDVYGDGTAARRVVGAIDRLAR